MTKTKKTALILLCGCKFTEKIWTMQTDFFYLCIDKNQ